MDWLNIIPEILEDIEATVVALGPSPWLMLAVLVFSCIDGFFPPVPSESIVIAAAVLVVTGDLPLGYMMGVILLAAVGAFLGDLIAYAIGSRVPLTRMPMLRGRRGRTTIHRTRRAFNNRGSTLVLTGRFIPVGRVAVNMTAGATGFPLARYVPLAALGSVLWAGFTAATGIGAGQFIQDSPLLAVCVGILAGALAGLFIDWLLRKRYKRSVARAEQRQEKSPNTFSDIR